MSETMVVYTQSYPGSKNKNGYYPAHVIDVIHTDLLDYYVMQGKYASILSPNNSNFQYAVQYATPKEFKKWHSPTGRRRYKIK